MPWLVSWAEMLCLLELEFVRLGISARLVKVKVKVNVKVRVKLKGKGKGKGKG